MAYIGDIRLGDTIDIKFTTVGTTGAPTTLAGTPSVACYPGNSTTEITAGITLTVDFDARTGMHNVRIVATSGNGYATATDYSVVITAGTVGGTSVVGYVVGSFSIEKRSALMPTTGGRTLQVESDGMAYADAREWLGGTIATPTITGVPKADLTHVNGTAATSTGGRPEVNTTHAAGIAWGSGAITAASIASSALSIAKFATDVGTTAYASNPLAQAIGERLLTAMTTAGSLGKKIADIVLQTGDTYALANGANGFANIKADTAAILDDTGTNGVVVAAGSKTGYSLTAATGLGNQTADITGSLSGSVGSVTGSIGSLGAQAKLDVNAEVDTALSDIRLDELLAADSDIDGAAPPTVGSVFHELMSKDTGSFTFDQTTDSLEAVRDHIGDGTNLTEAGGTGDQLTALATAAELAKVPKSDGTATWNATALASINAEVVDALVTDTYVEPAAVPAATASLKDKIGWMFALARNKITQTSSTTTLRNDADGADIATAATSDNGTTYTRGEWV